MGDEKILSIAGTMAATTVGAGIFGLPYVFYSFGWLWAGLWMAGLALLVAYVHRLYLKSVKESYGRHRLLGLAEKHGGGSLRLFALVVIMGGLVLTLVAYLILVKQLAGLAFPGYEMWALIIFWLLTTAIIGSRTGKMMLSESLGALVIILAVLGILAFGMMHPVGESRSYHPFAGGWMGAVACFGPIVFALAGWTAVEPSYEYGKKRGLSLREIFSGMNKGTLISVMVYTAFVLGILLSAPVITKDTLSGLSGWPMAGVVMVMVLAFFAIWTSYVPIGIEIKKSAESDLGWSEWWSSILVFGIPPVLLVAGLDDFLRVIGLVGGVFLGLEYVMILWLARKILHPTGLEKKIIWSLTALFLLAAVYEIWVFVLG